MVLTNVDSYAAQYYLGHQLRTMRAIRSVGGGLLSSHYLVDCLDEQAVALCRALHSHPQLCLYNVRGPGLGVYEAGAWPCCDAVCHSLPVCGEVQAQDGHALEGEEGKKVGCIAGCCR